MLIFHLFLFGALTLGRSSADGPPAEAAAEASDAGQQGFTLLSDDASSRHP